MIMYDYIWLYMIKLYMIIYNLIIYEWSGDLKNKKLSSKTFDEYVLILFQLMYPPVNQPLQLNIHQWIGLRENLQESPIFNGKIYGFL